ncbi:MAG: hypothetical protein MJZ19_08795 [Paludibacteraceae bacterium]|nr:hypothetical protein [Paludibacteraceae bacterium]
MKKSYILMLLMMLVTLSSFAKKRLSDEEKIINEVWARTDMPEFDNHNVDPKYKDERVVVLAEYHELIGDAFNNNTKIALANIKYKMLTRQLLKINDNSAIEEYSTIKYKNNNDGQKNVVGIRIFKQNGKVVNLNSNDYIKLNSNLKARKQNSDITKIAVPNLQKGDLLEYFFYSEMESYGWDKGIDPMTYFLSSNEATQSFRFHGSFDSPSRVRYTTSDDNIIVKNKIEKDRYLVDVESKDLPKREQVKFTNKYRTNPFFRIFFSKTNMFCEDQSFDNNSKAGVVRKADNKIIYGNGFGWLSFKSFYSGATSTIEAAKLTSLWARDYFKKHPNLTEEQKADALFDVYRNKVLCIYPYNGYSEISFLNRFVELLSEFKIQKSLVLLPNNNYFSADNVIRGYADEYDYAIMINSTGKLYYNTFSDYPSASDKMPQYEGETAGICKFTGKRLKLHFKADNNEISTKKIPIATPEENKTTYTIDAKISDENPYALDVNREVALYGSGRNGMRKKLGTFVQYDSTIRAYYDIKKTAIEDLRASKMPFSVPNYRNYTEEDKTKIERMYEREAKNYFCNNVEKVYDYKLHSLGLVPNDTVLRYSSNCRVDAMIKNADGTKVISVGHLLAEKNSFHYDTERKSDIYFNNTFKDEYNITLNIPKGYTVKNIDYLNKNTKNDCGGFESNAKIEDDKIIIGVSWNINNIYFKSSEWSKILNILDTFDEFYSSSVVLYRSE